MFHTEGDILRSARKIAILTGAGISTESRIPTFRDALTGLWARHNPEDLATEEAFRRNPQMVWDWYAYRREKVENAKPNAGHCALAELQKQKPGTTLITQNVDGLHELAGSVDTLELHGNIHHVKCLENCGSQTFLAREISGTRCPSCGAWLRPAVVWFGESLPETTLARAFAAARNCDVFLCIGTSALVHPAASLPLEALRNGATLIEVNPSSTPLTEAAHSVITATAAYSLPKLVALF
jgi:NAD-dependent deacetylase